MRRESLRVDGRKHPDGVAIGPGFSTWAEFPGLGGALPSLGKDGFLPRAAQGDVEGEGRFI